MGERRITDPATPGVVELELDEGLEDTRCLACQLEGRARPIRDCPHTPEERARAVRAIETQEVARLAGEAPRSALIAAMRAILGWPPWWATKEGRRRIGKWLEEAAAAREKERHPMSSQTPIDPATGKPTEGL